MLQFQHCQFEFRGSLIEKRKADGRIDNRSIAKAGMSDQTTVIDAEIETENSKKLLVTEFRHLIHVV